jgi:hypothetical protein
MLVYNNGECKHKYFAKINPPHLATYVSYTIVPYHVSRSIPEGITMSFSKHKQCKVWPFLEKLSTTITLYISYKNN